MITHSIIHNRQGFVLATVMWILLLLVFLGMGAITRSGTELLISGNDKQHQTAFYAAEAARGFIQENPVYYGDTNTTPGEGVDVPVQTIGDAQYQATVTYIEKRTLPRTRSRGTQTASGTGPDPKAHHYQMDCTGTVPSTNSTSRVSARFYRVGF